MEAQASRFVRTQREVADALGVNRHSVKEWLAQGAPNKTDEGYDVDAIAAWREIHKRNNEPVTLTDIDNSEYQRRLAMAKLMRAEADGLKAKADALIKEHDARKTTENVVHLDDVERFLTGLFSETRRVLMRIPKEMKAGYAKEIREDLENDIEARLSIALRTMAGYCRRVTELRE